MDAESTSSSPSLAHALPVPLHLPLARLPSLHTMPTALHTRPTQELVGDLTHPSPKKAGGILVPRAGHCSVHQPLSLHQVCLSPPVKSYLNAKWWYEAFSSMPVQPSVDSLCWNTAGESPDCLHRFQEHLSACLPAEPRAARRAGASCGSALAYCCQASRSSQDQSILKPQLGDLLRARREGGGGQGKVRAVAHQPQSTTEEQPGHQAALPATAPQGQIQLPTYWAAHLWGAGGPCVRSQQINPGTPSWFIGRVVRSFPRLNIGQKRFSLIAYLFCPLKVCCQEKRLHYKSTLSVFFKDVILLKGLVNLALHTEYSTDLVHLICKTIQAYTRLCKSPKSSTMKKTS